MTAIDSSSETGQAAARRSAWETILWRAVFTLAALLLIGAITALSVAMLVPDAAAGSCTRPQLVRPEHCLRGNAYE